MGHICFSQVIGFVFGDWGTSKRIVTTLHFCILDDPVVETDNGRLSILIQIEMFDKMAVGIFVKLHITENRKNNNENFDRNAHIETGLFDN